jgi:hypothetical protein
MSKSNLKFVLAAAGALLAVFLVFLSIQGLGELTAYFQGGADPAAALQIVPNTPPDWHARVEWLADDVDTGRQMESFTRQQIEASYKRAWLQYHLAFLRASEIGLKTYFVDPALEAVTSSVAQAVAQGWIVQQTDSDHSLKLHFYSADGSVVSFTDQAARISQVILDEEGQVVFTGEMTSRYEVVMFLEDGNWRVMHWLRTGEAVPGEGFNPHTADSAPFVEVNNGGLEVGGVPFEVRGVNYYPQDTPWELFGTRYRPETIDQDFDQIRSLGLNTIRIFIPFEQFGGALVTADMLDQMDDLIRRAENHELYVIVTLFDFRTDYGLLLWPSADRHLEQILMRFMDQPAILAWDLKNEPDLDYDANRREVVDAWLAHLLPTFRRYAPNHLVTVGWSRPDAAGTLSEALDLVSFHYFGDPAEFPSAYEKLQNQVAGKPILLSEFGLPSWNSPFFPIGHNQKEQALYYARILNALGNTGSPGFLAWTLYDFGEVPPNVVGYLPWRVAPQKHFGLVDLDGNPKLAVQALVDHQDLERFDLAWADTVNPFWLTIAVIGSAVSAFVIYRVKR